MTSTVSGVFLQANDAQRAVGALMDHGIDGARISVVTPSAAAEPPPVPDADDFAEIETDDPPTPTSMNDFTEARRGHSDGDGTMVIEEEGKHGITVTTAEDARRGAMEGGIVGLSMGVLAGMAALTLPGVGMVLAAGPLWAAVGGAAAATAAGAVAGGAIGYLEDQGVHSEEAHRFVNVLADGSSVVSVRLTGDESDEQVREILAKYGGASLAAE